MTHPDLHPAPLAPEITQPVTGQQINQLDEQANEQPLSYLTMTAEEHQLQQEHGDHFDLSDHRLYELKHHQEAYAKELAAREGSSYQLKGKSGVSQTEQAYAKAVFALAEARSVETDATKIDAYGNKQAHYDSRKATREALFILLGSSAPDGQLEGDGQLFSLTDAKHDQRLLRTGRYEKGLGGVEEIESGKFRRALNSCYDKWGEWSQQGVRGFAKKAAAGAAAG